MKQRILIALMFLGLGLVFFACNNQTTQAPTSPVTTSVTQPPVTTEAPLPTTLDLLPDLNAAPGNIYGPYKLSISEGVATVNYNKYGYAWTEMAVEIEEAVSRFNKLVVTAKGDGPLLVRFVGEDEVYDVRLALGVNDQTFQINLRDEDDFLETLEKIVLIAAPGNVEARGQIVISNLKFDTGTAFGTVKEIELPTYDVTYGWNENDEDTYDFTVELDDSVSVEYTKLAGQEWVYAVNELDTNLTLGYNHLTVVIEGTDTKQVLIKLNNRFEKWVTFDGTEQTIEIVVPETLAQIMLFAEGGVAPVTGEFSIKSMLLSYVEPAGDIDEFSIIDFTTGWVDNGDSVYTFSVDDGVTTVNYDKGAHAWATMKYEFSDNLSLLNTVTLVVQGTDGKQILFKDSNNKETWITFDGTEQTIKISFAGPITNALIFAEGGTESVTGSFDIISAKVSYTADGTNVNVGWVENDADTYEAVVGDTGVVTINYTKNADQSWAFMRTIFDEEDAEGLNGLVLVLTGTPGKQVLIKPNDAGSLETWVTFQNDQPHFVYVSADAFTNCIIFAEPNVPSVSGSFSILRAVLTYIEPDALPRDSVVDFESGWVDNGDGVYTISEDGGVTTVNYDKGAHEWATMKYEFKDNLSLLNTVTLVVQGVDGKQILFKDSNNKETWITFDGTEQTVVISFVGPITSALIFAEGGTASATGSFDIISATVSFVAAPLEITDGWAENDLGTYTIDQDNVDGSVVVNYATTGAYQFMINNFDLEDTVGLNTLTIVVQGTSGKELLIKPNDLNAMEQIVTFDGTEQTFTYTADVWAKMLLFAAPGVDGGETGTFTIVSMVLTYVEPSE
ncbi:MAG: hypothetical protein PHO96_03560 [Candidatus Izemoplasmatales bacterium]|nr:hypothetical protein [Candidatus Izemoplasmatales bacterium]